MKKAILPLSFLILVTLNVFGQSKPLLGIVPFENSNRDFANQIQDAVSDVFVKSKRFSMVEREKMDKIKVEKKLQTSSDFIDGSVIEQSKSLGAQYIVLGNISKAEVIPSRTTAPLVGTITTYHSQISMAIRVVDVTTSEIIASNIFSETGKGKNLNELLDKIKPQVEKFIKDNFKITAIVASIEETNKAGEAVKVLIGKGKSTGVMVNDKFTVYVSETMDIGDGQKRQRKRNIGEMHVEKVEDDDFSICVIDRGGKDIADKIKGNLKVKCDIINE